VSLNGRTTDRLSATGMQIGRHCNPDGARGIGTASAMIARRGLECAGLNGFRKASAVRRNLRTGPTGRGMGPPHICMTIVELQGQGDSDG